MDEIGGMLGVPWAHPWPDAFFEGSDNLRGDAAVNILPLIVLVHGPLLLLVSGFRETLGSSRAVDAARRPAMMAASYGREHRPVVGTMDRKEDGEDFITSPSMCRWLE